MVWTRKGVNFNYSFRKNFKPFLSVKTVLQKRGKSVTEGQGKTETFIETNTKRKGSTFESPDIEMSSIRKDWSLKLESQLFFSCCWLLKYENRKSAIFLHVSLWNKPSFLCTFHFTVTTESFLRAKLSLFSTDLFLDITVSMTYMWLWQSCSSLKQFQFLFHKIINYYKRY